MRGIEPAAVPPARVVAPYLVAAPLGLALAGFVLLFAGDDALAGPSTQPLLAATHGVILGWLTLSIMGATFQLVPSVLGGRPPAAALAQLAFALHAAGTALFVVAFAAWRTPLIAAGALLTLAGILLYLVAAARPLITARPLTPELLSLRLAHVALLLTASAGITYALALHAGWFAVTPDLIAAHAHLGLAGWLALAITGVTYRLLPMFGIVRGVSPRFSGHIPWGLAGYAAVAFLAMAVGLPRVARLGVEIPALGLGAAWLSDVVILYRHRLRRRFDHYSAGTIASWWMLAASLLLLPAAVLLPDDASPASANAVIAFGFLFIGGWAGSTLAANSYKIVPFIAWYHRFGSRVGASRDLPGTADLYSARLARAVLTLVVLGSVLGAIAGLTGAVPVLRAAGAAYAAAGLAAATSLAGTFVVRPGRHRSVGDTQTGPATPAQGVTGSAAAPRGPG